MQLGINILVEFMRLHSDTLWLQGVVLRGLVFVGAALGVLRAVRDFQCVGFIGQRNPVLGSVSV